MVGSFNVDHVWTCATLPRAGETLAGRYRSGAGGKGFNQAVAAARAGAATTFVCALGEDPGAQLARALAAADDIDLRDQRSTEPTGTAGIHVDADGRNRIVIGPGANETLSTGFIAAQAGAIAGASLLLVQFEAALDATGTALRLARDAGVATVLNPAPADAEATTALLALADILTPNESEFAALAGRRLGERIDPHDVTTLSRERLHALCRLLLPHGTVVVTLGASGSFVSHPDGALRGDPEAHYRISAEPAKAIDTTGAGDAFNGALAAALAQAPAAPFVEHVRFAGRYAAVSTERPGAAGSMPRLAELQAPSGVD